MTTHVNLGLNNKHTSKKHAKNSRIMNPFVSEWGACEGSPPDSGPAQPQILGPRRVSPTNHGRQTRQPNTQRSEQRGTPKEEVPGFSGRVYVITRWPFIFSPGVEDLSSFLVDRHPAPCSRHSSKTVLQPVLASPRAATDFRLSLSGVRKK
jgi:hypothetical protein